VDGALLSSELYGYAPSLPEYIRLDLSPDSRRTPEPLFKTPLDGWLWGSNNMPHIWPPICGGETPKQPAEPAWKGQSGRNPMLVATRFCLWNERTAAKLCAYAVPMNVLRFPVSATQS